MKPERGSTAPDAAGGCVLDGFEHDALFYADTAEYVEGVCAFARAGLAAGEPVLLAVPAAKLALLREGLGADAGRVELLDMSELGRNPSRIIPAVRGWVDDQPPGRMRFVGEPLWPERRACESIARVDPLPL